ncbi:TATA box-binding protein-associated factor RNA polymerase I subunit A isoform X2 [Colossoma macropomum]|uniref:TATA box-binding protein-associated factor RNA polymerase I subunit A isoform X2 n=1 Tax=Colossoma macropomum TaxID=42526 RepID=UPI0018651B18|nr:TATA box-binding protein-associated factor RNA polymerase I subunit A isoform X2 [Colossoma macropomum]
MDDIEAELNISGSDVNDSSEDERILRKIKSPSLPSLVHVSPTNARSKESGFHKSTRLCLKAIRDAMLHHRWQDAAHYLAAYSQMLEETTAHKQSLACEIIWRLGTEVLQHHPNSRLEDFNALYERMKNSGVKNYAKICLEHSFHLLLNGNFNDAKRQLSVAASWRYGKQSASQSMELKLIHAYCGFLDYFIWCTKKSSGTSSDANTSREMHSYFRQASVTLQEIITQPGVWDPFVLSYVDMLEFYNDQEGALKVLQNYAYNKDYPSNPNAHVYLYQFLKRHKAPPAKLISTLKVLHCLVPSHELMLEYCSLLLKSEVEEDMQDCLTIAMNLLDYPSWKYDLNAWNCLLKVMTVLKKNGLKHLIDKEWEKRRDLWLTMHYRNCHGKKDSEENAKLLFVKAKVSKIFGEHKRGYNKFTSQVLGIFHQEDSEKKRKRRKRMFVSAHD